MALDVRGVGDLALVLVAGAMLFRTAAVGPASPRPGDARVELATAWVLRRVSLAAGGVFILSLLLAPRDWTTVLRLGLAVLLLLRPGPRVRLAQAAAVIWFAALLGLLAVVGGPPHVESVHFLYVVLPSVVYGMIAGLGTLIVPLVPDLRVPELRGAPAALATALALAQGLAPHATGHGAPVAAVADAARMLAGVLAIGGTASALVVLAACAPGQRREVGRRLVAPTLALAGVGLVLLLFGGLDAAPALPTLNAGLNATSGLLAAAAYRAIRRGQITRHRRLMLSALGASVLFLVSYLYYHAQVGTTRFAVDGWPRTVYTVILVSHTVLAAIIVPLVVVTLRRALAGRFARHLRIARITLPLWLYVSVTGVVVYLMLYRLFQSPRP
jgi:uncharacterized membrane protein YozB (DUF420 family)